MACIPVHRHRKINVSVSPLDPSEERKYQIADLSPKGRGMLTDTACSTSSCLQLTRYRSTTCHLVSLDHSFVNTDHTSHRPGAFLCTRFASRSRSAHRNETGACAAASGGISSRSRLGRCGRRSFHHHCRLYTTTLTYHCNND